jgi:Mg-chelatase subunit ChlD
MATGKTFTFPLKLYSSNGYKGNVKLALAVSPPEPGLTRTFSPASVALETKAKDTLTVKAAPSAKMQTYTLQVTGTDEKGMQNYTFLALVAPAPERKNGTLNILAPPQVGPSSRNIEIILDASGSMKEMIGGGASKIQIARKVLTDVLAKLPDDTNVALRVYGHRLSSKDPNTCTDSELVVPLEKLDRDQITTTVNKINPRGETPLVYSILKAQGDFGDTKAGSIVVVTDGGESCHGDTKTVGEKLKAAGFDFKLNIIGFGITQAPLQKELQAMAGSTAGQYFTATSSGALGAALLKVAAEKKTFVVLDVAGGEVARGVVGEPLTLAPGTYRVTVLGDEPVSLNGVTIAPGASVLLKLVPAGEKWELQP